MEQKEIILGMYKDAARGLEQTSRDFLGAELDSEQRDHAERLYGERQAYGRILKELYGVKAAELQAVLDEIYSSSRREHNGRNEE